MLEIGRFTETAVPLLTECHLPPLVLFFFFLMFTTGPPSRCHVPNVTGQETEAWGKVNDLSTDHIPVKFQLLHSELSSSKAVLFVLYHAALFHKILF